MKAIPVLSWLLLAPLALGVCPVTAGVNVPDPVLLLDFENGSFAAGKGIVESDCLDVTGQDQASALVLSDPKVLEQLEGAWSFTVTGWMRRKVDLRDDDATTQCILNCPGRFRVITDGRYRWRLGMEIVGTDEKPIRVMSTWLADFQPHDRWVFFAVSYDGTRSDRNYGVYCGHEEYPVKEDASGVLSIGQLSANPAGRLVIGASTKDGGEPLKGMLDNIRIYATREKTSACALDWQQLDRVRRSDLGSKFLEQVASDRASRRQAETEALERIEERYWNKSLNLHRIDSLERIFPDRPPAPVPSNEPLSVPRGGQVALQFAAMARSESKTKYSIKVSPLKNADGQLAAKVKTYKLIDVPVEANNNGGMRTSVKTKPPPVWMEEFVREAPFRVAEALVESDSVELGGDPSPYNGILATVDVSPDATPGVYKGVLELKSANGEVSSPFAIRVHKTRRPANPALSTHYWLSPDPRDLTSRQPPEWWSEEHWRLLENAGRTLREYGQDTLWTPLINYEKPLIVTTREKDGSYTFDFTKFDRWMETFLKLGFKRMAGQQIVSLPGGRGINIIDKASGKTEWLFGGAEQQKAWIDFIPVFFDSLYEHIQQKGWVDDYIQHLYDEPKDLEKYKTLAALLRTHMPGVRSIDAVRTQPEYSPLVDMHVFDVFMIYPHAQRLVAERKSRGQESWLYHCCSPYPPYPNRHLDERLSDSRLYPWLCYLMNADGYLYWAANMYRGADPYKTSVGPLPNGSQDPGHPPGDNWMFYPAPDGLRGSMRMVAFMDGMQDHTLLSMLAAKDKARADEIMRMVARDTVDYAKEPGTFHAARKALLEALDSLE